MPVALDRTRRGRDGETTGAEDGTGTQKVVKEGFQEDALPAERVDQPPFLITRFEPSYPEAARQHHLVGMVILQAIIGASGRVEELHVVKSAGALLDAAALSAVERWVYRPAMLNGRPVRVRLGVTVDFALH